MKRIILVLAAALLLLTGCDLRNRRPSSEFIPKNPTPVTTAATEAPTETESAPVETRQKELTRHTVRTISTDQNTYVDIYGTQWSYETHIPFVDYPTKAVSDCNSEIDRIYARANKDQQECAESQQPLTILAIDYECYYTGELVTLNVWMDKSDGTTERSVYCFRSNGTMASTTEILTSVWMDPDAFLAKLRELAAKAYARYNSAEADSVTYDKYLEKTLEEIEEIDLISVYADAEDRITAMITLYDVHGGSEVIELPVKP